MKNFIFAAIILCLCAAETKGQAAKPILFGDYPQKIVVTESIFKNAFSSGKGQYISLSFDGGLTISGTVVSNEYKYTNLQNITIQAPAFNNAFFSISRIINEDKSVLYTGRILNNKAADGYEIKRDSNGVYTLIKFEQKRILQDCSYN